MGLKAGGTIVVGTVQPRPVATIDSVESIFRLDSKLGYPDVIATPEPGFIVPRATAKADFSGDGRPDITIFSRRPFLANGERSCSCNVLIECRSASFLSKNGEPFSRGDSNITGKILMLSLDGNS